MNDVMDDLKSEIWKTLSVAISGVALYLVVDLRRGIQEYFGKRRKQHPPVETMVDGDRRTAVAAAVCLDRLGPSCIRVYVAKFHNGEYFDDDSSVYKYTRTYEHVRAPYSYEAREFEKMLISRVPEEMKLILEEGPSYTLVSDIPRGLFRWLCEDRGGVKAVARCAIYKGKRRIGFIGADFYWPDGDEPSPIPVNINEVCRLAETIGRAIDRGE